MVKEPGGGDAIQETSIPFDVPPGDDFNRKAFSGVYFHNETFAIRGNSVREEVPFVVTCGFDETFAWKAIKISTSANAGVFQAGAELETGFIIQNAENIYNQYSMDGTIMVQVSGTYNVGNPFITPSGMISLSDYGILRNE